MSIAPSSLLELGSVALAANIQAIERHHTCAVEDSVHKHIAPPNHVEDQVILNNKVPVSHLGYSMIGGNLSRVRMLLETRKSPFHVVQ